MNEPRQLEDLLTTAIRKARWQVKRPSASEGMQQDLVATGGKRKYVFEIKKAVEGRRDWLIPLFSQAVLQAQAAARDMPGQVLPVAVVGAPRVASSTAQSVLEFAKRFAPEVGVGVMDLQGFRAFSGRGLEVLNAPPPARPPRYFRREPVAPRYEPHLFSDLNQWMLKVLLAKDLPEPLLAAPREELASGAHLARASQVSVMSAARLLRQLARDGFLREDRHELRIARKEDLLEQWVANSHQASVREVPVRLILRGNKERLFRSIREYAVDVSGDKQRKLPRICLGLFAAADRLGLGFVRGVEPHIYLERFDRALVERLGLTTDEAASSPDAYVRIPKNKESLYRGSVIRRGIPVADVLQTWLDVSANPAGGKEQAREIQRRALRKLCSEG